MIENGMGWCATQFDGDSRKTRGERVSLRIALVAVVAVYAAAMGGARATESSDQAHVSSAGNLEHRVAVLSKALDLDARQRTELAKILASQREAVRRVWSDPALLAPEKIPATRAVEDRTADAIRSILTDEQKKKYNPPRPPAAPTPSSGPPDVGAWMEKTRAK